MSDNVHETECLHRAPTGNAFLRRIRIFRKRVIWLLARVLALVQGAPWYAGMIRCFPRAEVEIVCRPEAAGYRFSALRGSREVGYVLLQHFEKRSYPGWWVFAFRVGIFLRLQGIGRRLIRTVIDFSRQQGIPVLYLNVYTDSPHVIRLYEGEGFRRIPFTEERLQGFGREFVCMRLLIREETIKGPC